ncbi:MAG: hypothetical protein E7195_02090 [Peptococcaceae bacterium]|nr:hypothetical protein [Peptococcaceae bacterium]
MKTVLKDILGSMPNSVKAFFGAIIFSAIVFPKYVLALAVIPVNALFIIILITKSGQFHFLITMMVCFTVACILRNLLPESSKHLAKCWLLISFMLCLSYGHVYYLNQNLFFPVFPLNADVAFLLCCIPGLLGLWMGRVMKRDSEAVLKMKH